MANTKTWPDPDSQVGNTGRKDVMGVYMIDPVTQKATTPGGGGAITNDGTFAKETGGHLAQIDTNTTGLATQTTLAAAKTDLDTIVTNTTGGATAANQTTGNTSLSTIATNTTGMATAANQTTSNTNTANTATVLGATTDAAVTGDNAGTISAKQRGLSKILADIWDSVNHLFAMNIKQWNGATPGVTNPVITEDQIRAWIANGQAFSATTGKVTAAANMAAQFWVPSSSAKNVLIWSVRMAYANANQSGQLTLLSSQDANITGAGVVSDAANFTNLKAGGSAAASGATLQHNGGIATISGTPLDFFGTPLSQGVELLSPGMFILIPAGVAGGLGIYEATTAAGSWAATVRWCEY
jgi:hypothetical protein